MKTYDQFKKVIENSSIMNLLGSDGSCPCGDLRLFGIDVEVHCWRVRCPRCHYSGVHVGSSKSLDIPEEELYEIGKLFADYIGTAYNTEVNITIYSD